MVDTDGIVFNIAAFIGGLFVLEFGADKFIDHTAKLAARTRIPPTLIALLTAGAEWEELVVVVASISQHQSPLALGNILGSSISNILGAFSLGLLFLPSATTTTFDRSSKIYTLVLLGLTTFFAIFILFFERLGRGGGALLCALFVLYIASIGWAIYKGIVEPPVDSDSDSDSTSDLDSSSDSDSDNEEVKSSIPLRKPKTGNTHLHVRTSSTSSSTTTLHDLESGSQHTGVPPSPANPPPTAASSELHKDIFSDVNLSPATTPTRGHSSIYHTTHLLIGFASLSLSGYILSHSISSLSSLLNLSSSLLGITLLSLATTLPEKLISVLSAKRGQTGIVVANTAGSNIFLVTLCAGVLYSTGDLAALKNSVTTFEVGVMWISSVVLCGIVWAGGRRWMGWCLLAAYISFLAAEFMMDRDVD